MKFTEALEQIMLGQLVTKKEWNNRAVHGILKDGTLLLKKEDGLYYQWILTDGDLHGDDYELV